MGLVLKSFNNILRFYRDGFKTMPAWGKKVWLVIIIKLFIIFAVLRIFFCPDILKRNFNNDEERGKHVLDELIIKTDTDD